MNNKQPIHIVRILILSLLAITFMVGCGGNNSAPDVSNIKVELTSQRLDKDLYNLDTNNIGAGLQKLQGQYPEFLGLWYAICTQNK